MSIWGKMAGAAAGLAVGGPIGALIGAVAGHYGLDRESGGGEGDPESDVVFTIALIALSAKMAKADGHVAPAEVLAFEDIFVVPPEERKNVERVYSLAQRDVAGYEAYAGQVARLYRDRPGVLEDVLDALFHIALADRVVHDDELDYLATVADIFGFSEREFRRIKASHLGPEAEDPYVILGIDHDAGDEDVRRAYRRMVQENHPDRLIARGVPEEFVGMATEKLKAINDAYERIRKERGMT